MSKFISWVFFAFNVLCAWWGTGTILDKAAHGELLFWHVFMVNANAFAAGLMLATIAWTWVIEGIRKNELAFWARFNAILEQSPSPFKDE